MDDKELVQPICEIFHSIQGEGRYAGIPHLVVRTTGCNLNCAFSNSICDTAYASWNPEQGQFTLADVEREMQRKRLVKHMFITGGEPTLHATLMYAIGKMAHFYGKEVAIETNGTNFIPNMEEVIDFVTISPKMRNSVPVLGNVAKSPWVERVITSKEVNRQMNNRAKYEDMRNWIRNYPHQVKYVVSNYSQLAEINEINSQIGVQRKNVYLMPEGDTPEKLNITRETAILLAMDNGFNYTDRLHIIAWGNQRGV